MEQFNSQSVIEQKRELAIEFERTHSLNTIREFTAMLTRYTDTLEYLEGLGELDADLINGVRFDLALKSLTLSQKVIPKLTALAAEMLQAAGKHAVRAACAPTKMWNRPGVLIREVKSEFELPPGNESPVNAAVGKIKEAAATVVAAVAAVALNR
jgi:hypothetical protein